MARKAGMIGLGNMGFPMAENLNNAILGAKMNKVRAGDLKPGFATELVVKDLELARQLCQEEQLPNFSLNSAPQLYRLAQARGHGRDDSSFCNQHHPGDLPEGPLTARP